MVVEVDIDHQTLLEKILVALYIDYPNNTQLRLEGWTEVTAEEMAYLRSIRPVPDVRSQITDEVLEQYGGM